jgi:sugar phosphate isomerase/epimerase
MTQVERHAPKFAVSACTTYHTTFEQDLENYRAVGIDGIGLWEYKLVDGRDDERAERLREAGLTATFCFPGTPGIVAGGLFPEPADPAERLRLLCGSIRRFATYRPEAVVCLAGAAVGDDIPVLRRHVVAALREAAHVAGEAGVRLALEIIRPGAAPSLVSTIPQGLDLIADMQVDNVGLLVDAWHCAELPDIQEHIARHIGEILGFQVCDRAADSRGWYDRAMPGEGVLPLVDLLRAAIGAGYQGWYELEIFSDDGTLGNDYPHSLWKRLPTAVLRGGLQSFQRVWASAYRA